MSSVKKSKSQNKTARSTASGFYKDETLTKSKIENEVQSDNEYRRSENAYNEKQHSPLRMKSPSKNTFVSIDSQVRFSPSRQENNLGKSFLSQTRSPQKG